MIGQFFNKRLKKEEGERRNQIIEKLSMNYCVAILIFASSLFKFSEVYAATETLSFTLDDGKTFYLHNIEYKDLTGEKLNNYQSMVAVNNKIYIAKNNTDGTAPVISVYDAITLEQLDDIPLVSTFKGKIYLVKDFDDNVFAFRVLEKLEIGKTYNLIFEPIVCNDNTINSPLKFEWDESEGETFESFSCPIVNGSIASGTFDISFVFCSGYKYQVGESYVNDIQNSFYVDGKYLKNENEFGKLKLITTIDGYNNNFCTLSRIITDDKNLRKIYIIDDNSSKPYLIYNNQSYFNKPFPEKLTNVLSHGVNNFEFMGHTFFIYGKECEPGEISYGIAEFKDKDYFNINDVYNYFDEKDLDEGSLTEVCEISFNSAGPILKSANDSWSNPFFNGNNMNYGNSPYQISQVNVMPEYKDGIALIHLYVPGGALATYQLNTNENTTEISKIFNENPAENDTPQILGRLIQFKSAHHIEVYSLSGRKIADKFNSEHIDLSECPSGFYILRTEHSTHKILIK